jgi:transposase-like protein
MTSKTTNKFSPEVRDRSVRMVLDHEKDHVSRWAAVVSIAEKIGCAPQTLNVFVRSAAEKGVVSNLSSWARAEVAQEPTVPGQPAERLDAIGVVAVK